MKKTFSQRVREIPGRIRRSRMKIVVVVFWSLLIAALVSMEFHNYLNDNEYIFSRILRSNGLLPYSYIYSNTGLTGLDLIVICVASLCFGVFLDDIKELLFGFISVIVISTVLATAYVANVIWTYMGYSHLLSNDYVGWSWVAYWGFLAVFREMFPGAIMLAFLCALVGLFLRSFY